MPHGYWCTTAFIKALGIDGIARSTVVDGAFNGTVPNASRLQKDHDLWPVTQCDSEIIALLIETANGTLARRCAAALAEIRPQRRARDGEQGAALLGLWSKARPTLILARNGKP